MKHSRVRKLQWAGGIALLLVLIAAGTVYYFLSGDRVANLIGGKGTAATGRELTVNGGFAIDWDWSTPTVKIEDIRLSNIEGSEDPQMVEVGALEFKIRPWKLFLGRMELPELTITSPKIILEKDAEGNKNWEFPALSKSNAAASAALPDSRSNFPVIGQLTITDGVLVYRDKQKDLDLSLSVETITGSPEGENQTFELKGNGTLQDQKFTIDATGGSLKDLRDSSKDYPLDLALTMGATAISVKGTFRDPVKLTGINTVLSIKGNNMADLFYLTAIPLPPSPPYSLEGSLKKEGDVWAFEDFKGKVGDSDLNGTLKYDVSGERGMVTANLVSALLDIDDMGGFIGATPSVKKGETASPEQKQEAKEKQADARVLPDMKLDLSRLRTTDMDVTLKAQRIEAPGVPLETMNVRFDLQNGLLKLNPMDLGVAGGIIDGSLELDGRKDTPDIRMDLNLKKLRLKSFFKGSQFESFSAGTFGGRVKLAGQGKSMAEVLGGSNGHVTMSMSGGQISLLIVEAAGIDIGELTPLLLGEDKNTEIRCVVADFDVKDGLLNSNALVFDTTDSNINGTAKINLKNEAMDIRVEAHPKDQSLLALRTPITVQGTMKNPAIGIDPSGLAAKGAGAAILGVLLTPVASIIPFIELGLGEDSNCKGLISQAKSNSAKAAPKP